MRWMTAALLTMLAFVHAELWLGKTGMPRVLDLRAKYQAQQAGNDAARARNSQLDAEVRDLKEGLEMVEEKARFDLGMVKPDEIYVQVTAAKR